MNDGVRHSQTHIDIVGQQVALLTLDIVSRRFIAAGLPRSMRTLQRYCANGTLDCVKEATETGDTYFVIEQSIETAITALKQLHDAKDRPPHGATERAVTGHEVDVQASQIGDDFDGHSPTTTDSDAQELPARQASSGTDTSRYVAQLEARLGEKDEEIDFLREELIDRRGQIRDMKGIIDGQNQLLETIQTNVAPIFNALASTVKAKGLGLTPEPPAEQRRTYDPEGGHDSPSISDHHQGREEPVS